MIDPTNRVCGSASAALFFGAGIPTGNVSVTG